MNLVFLSSEIIHQIHLINEIHRRYPITKVFFQPPPDSKRSSFSEKLQKLTNPKKVRRYIRLVLRDLLFHNEDDKQREYESRMFFSGNEPKLESSIPIECVDSFNTPEGVEAVRKTEPDVIVVFGADILRGEILNVAKRGILNIHRDILPNYRGGGLPFWVFYNRDFENLGVTVHVCTSQLDGGDIVGQRRYKLQVDDGIHTLRYKTTLVAEELLLDVLAAYENNTVDYQKQKPAKLWTSKDLTIVKEYRARKNLRKYIETLKTANSV